MAPTAQPKQEPPETKLWRQQPAESDQHFYWFQVYLSLMFFQSTAQVAKNGWHPPKVHALQYRPQVDLAGARRRLSTPTTPATRSPRIKLQLHLLHDKAFEAHLHGLLDATRAIEIAEIGSLDREKARQNLSHLLRRQRSFLQSFWRQYDAIAGKSPGTNTATFSSPSLVEEKAIQRLRDEEEERKG